jgi:putative endonuclease
LIKIIYFFAAMYYVYILFSPNSDRYYIGHTPNVQKRLEEHNNPSRFDKYTAKHLPWMLILFFEISSDRGEAMIVERFIKKQKSRVFLEKLIEQKDNLEFFTDLVNNILKKKKVG